MAKESDVRLVEHLHAIDKLAHELGTPIAEILNHVVALKNYVHVFERRDSPEISSALERLERLESAASRAVAILAASKFVAQEQFHDAQVTETLEAPQALNINTLIEVAVNAVKNTRREQVSFRHSYSARCCLKCVPNEIIQILINILRNAYDALLTGAGQIEIQTLNLKVEDTSLPLGKIKVSVIDNGEGISDSEMKGVFTEGYSTRIGKSRGFGLAITKHLVQKNHGSIEIYSPPLWYPRAGGHGTQVVLEFPRTHCFNS